MIIINLQDVMFPFCFQKRKKAYEASKFRGSTASNKEYFKFLQKSTSYSHLKREFQEWN